ncbi:MAG: hypothetical protein P8X89_01715 [Reinekea sp.]
MDRVNWPYYNTGHYDQSYQQDGQHTFPPETGQTSGGVSTSGASASLPAPGQPYLNFSSPGQIPSWPSSDWEYLLRTPQPITMEDIIQPQPQAGQTSAGIEASGPSWSYPALGQPQPYHDINTPAQIPSWPRPDWGVPQPITWEDISQNDERPEPAAKQKRRKTSTQVEESFLAGLDHYAQGVSLKDCSAIIEFRFYASDQGHLRKKGRELRDRLPEQDQARVDRALLSRRIFWLNRAMTNSSVEERFLAGLDPYVRGAQLKDCSATISYRRYVSSDGHLTPTGQTLYDKMSAEDQTRVNQALLSRREISSKQVKERVTDKVSVEERFLASLDNYAAGMSLRSCSRDIRLEVYLTDDGRLRPGLGQGGGEFLYNKFSQDDKVRVNQAMLSRRIMYLQRMIDNSPVEERFLASLDNYAEGMAIANCSRDIFLSKYVTDDGRLREGPGESLYKRLSQDDKMRVNQALTTRRRIASKRLSRDLDNFMTTLEPYANGQPFEEFGNQPGLKKKVITYLTPEGGLTHKGELLIENLLPDQQIEVWIAIEKRRRLLDPSAQVPESPWQLPEMPSSMPELGGMNQAEMVDPMQTEAMWASAWQLTGQAVPGTWGIPAESAEPPIPHYGSDVVGTDFQHRYDSNGLMPQSAPDRLIGRGIEDRMLINILGEEYRVHYTGSSGNPTNENPYGKKFMLVPRIRGG